MKNTAKPHEKLPGHMRDFGWKMNPWWAWNTVCLFFCALHFLLPSLTSSPNTGVFLGEFQLTVLCWLEALGQGISEMRSMSVLLPAAVMRGEKIKSTNTSQQSLLEENMPQKHRGGKGNGFTLCP